METTHLTLPTFTSNNYTTEQFVMQTRGAHCQGRRESEPNWEPGGVRSGAGIPSSGASQESSGSSEIWEAAFFRLCRRR